MSITVVSPKTLSDSFEGKRIYIDRRGVLGNPFELEGESNREAVVRAFGVYLYQVYEKDADPAEESNRLAQKHGLAISKSWKRPTREAFVTKFTELLTLHKEQTSLELVCHCKHPEKEVACHGDMYVRAINYYATKEF
ncbi:DUF4326 domain-containing protein (plasmid) [Kovacikia minuta CCNUW1]|uniref:DUF4326 domain-containing protein n=1 Tax=Kovacikia minuta TaxID=2931930 RepID=UPI001CC9B660|nr:DUF4326 domain-containing protein [Kovacikia minuta]UBF29878.1 DUF4326 domain-containing protein [Kovacikia minuta CCNUW1]